MEAVMSKNGEITCFGLDAYLDTYSINNIDQGGLPVTYLDPKRLQVTCSDHEDHQANSIDWEKLQVIFFVHVEPQDIFFDPKRPQAIYSDPKKRQATYSGQERQLESKVEATFSALERPRQDICSDHDVDKDTFSAQGVKNKQETMWRTNTIQE